MSAATDTQRAQPRPPAVADSEDAAPAGRFARGEGSRKESNLDVEPEQLAYALTPAELRREEQICCRNVRTVAVVLMAFCGLLFIFSCFSWFVGCSVAIVAGLAALVAYHRCGSVPQLNGGTHPWGALLCCCCGTGAKAELQGVFTFQALSMLLTVATIATSIYWATGRNGDWLATVRIINACLAACVLLLQLGFLFVFHRAMHAQAVWADGYAHGLYGTSVGTILGADAIAALGGPHTNDPFYDNEAREATLSRGYGYSGSVRGFAGGNDDEPWPPTSRRATRDPTRDGRLARQLPPTAMPFDDDRAFGSSDEPPLTAGSFRQGLPLPEGNPFYEVSQAQLPGPRDRSIVVDQRSAAGGTGSVGYGRGIRYGADAVSSARGGSVRFAEPTMNRGASGSPARDPRLYKPDGYDAVHDPYAASGGATASRFSYA